MQELQSLGNLVLILKGCFLWFHETCNVFVNLKLTTSFVALENLIVFYFLVTIQLQEKLKQFEERLAEERHNRLEERKRQRKEERRITYYREKEEEEQRRAEEKMLKGNYIDRLEVYGKLGDRSSLYSLT